MLSFVSRFQVSRNPINFDHGKSKRYCICAAVVSASGQTALTHRSYSNTSLSKKSFFPIQQKNLNRGSSGKRMSNATPTQDM